MNPLPDSPAGPLWREMPVSWKSCNGRIMISKAPKKLIVKLAPVTCRQTRVPHEVTRDFKLVSEARRQRLFYVRYQSGIVHFYCLLGLHRKVLFIQHGGAFCVITRITMGLLRGSRSLQRKWPPRHPNLTSTFLWGFLKEGVYHNNTKTANWY